MSERERLIELLQNGVTKKMTVQGQKVSLIICLKTALWCCRAR